VQRFIHRRTALNGFNLNRSPRWTANVRTQNVLAGNKAAFITLLQTPPMLGCEAPAPSPLACVGLTREEVSRKLC